MISKMAPKDFGHLRKRHERVPQGTDAIIIQSTDSYLLPLITGHYKYYSRCAQFANTPSARIFDCSLPERESEINQL